MKNKKKIRKDRRIAYWGENGRIVGKKRFKTIIECEQFIKENNEMGMGYIYFHER